MRPHHAYTPKLIFPIYSLCIPFPPSETLQILFPASLHPFRLLNNVPAALHLCYDFRSLQKTFTHLRTSSDFIPASSEIPRCLSTSLPLFVSLFARTSTSVPVTHRTYPSTVKTQKHTIIYPSDFIPIHSHIRTCHQYGKPALQS
jgi:hypothetical protein